MLPDFGKASESVRGAAASIVAIAHGWQVFLYPFDADALPFKVLGSLATWSVATFFLLSGILIAISVKSRSSDRFDFTKFIAARSLRIFPPLVLAIIVTVGAVMIIQYFDLYGAKNYLLPGDEAVAREFAYFSWSDAFSTLTLTYNLIPDVGFLSFNGPLWSLSYEFWLYVLAGLFASGLLNRSLSALIGATVLAAWMIFISNSIPPFWSVGVVWGLGFLLGWHWRVASAIATEWLLTISIACLLFSLVVARDDLNTYIVSAYTGVRQQTFYVTFSAFISCLLILFLRSGLKDGMVIRSFAFIGSFSYTLYLIHFPLYLFVFSLFRPYILAYGLLGHVIMSFFAVFFVFIAAAISGHFVEDRPRIKTLITRATGMVGARP